MAFGGIEPGSSIGSREEVFEVEPQRSAIYTGDNILDGGNIDINVSRREGASVLMIGDKLQIAFRKKFESCTRGNFAIPRLHKII